MVMLCDIQMFGGVKDFGLRGSRLLSRDLSL